MGESSEPKVIVKNCCRETLFIDILSTSGAAITYPTRTSKSGLSQSLNISTGKIYHYNVMQFKQLICTSQIFELLLHILIQTKN